MVIAVELRGDAVAYPVRQMAYHHVVNDQVGGVPDRQHLLNALPHRSGVGADDRRAVPSRSGCSGSTTRTSSCATRRPAPGGSRSRARRSTAPSRDAGWRRSSTTRSPSGSGRAKSRGAACFGRSRPALDEYEDWNWEKQMKKARTVAAKAKGDPLDPAGRGRRGRAQRPSARLSLSPAEGAEPGGRQARRRPRSSSLSATTRSPIRVFEATVERPRPEPPAQGRAGTHPPGGRGDGQRMGLHGSGGGRPPRGIPAREGVTP